jgi:hypothetical protein
MNTMTCWHCHYPLTTTPRGRCVECGFEYKCEAVPMKRRVGSSTVAVLAMLSLAAVYFHAAKTLCVDLFQILTSVIRSDLSLSIFVYSLAMPTFIVFSAFCYCFLAITRKHSVACDVVALSTLLMHIFLMLYAYRLF